MNDYKDINDLLTQTVANKSAFIDYLLEYVEGDYHCLDGSADKEITLLSSFAHTFKHIFALAILLKLQEKIDNRNYVKSFSDVFQNEIQQECKEFGYILFYIRNSLPNDILYENCKKYKSGNGIIPNKWDYPYNILDKQKAIIEELKYELDAIKSKYEHKQHDLEVLRCELEKLLESRMRELSVLHSELDFARMEREVFKQKYEIIVNGLKPMALLNPALALLLKKL